VLRSRPIRACCLARGRTRMSELLIRSNTGFIRGRYRMSIFIRSNTGFIRGGYQMSELLRSNTGFGQARFDKSMPSGQVNE
jgi:hypothetical protein